MVVILYGTYSVPYSVYPVSQMSVSYMICLIINNPKREKEGVSVTKIITQTPSLAGPGTLTSGGTKFQIYDSVTPFSVSWYGFL